MNHEREQCQHPGRPVVPFDAEKAKTMTPGEVRQLFPRMTYSCPACRSSVLCYASMEHYIAGDW